MNKPSSMDNTEAKDPAAGSLRFRRQILILAQQLLQNLDSMEDESERYQTQDLPAYNRWYESSFAPERELISTLERELAASVAFHNSIVAVSKMREVSLSQAFTAMRDEQVAYVGGSETKRRRIEEERLAREEFIREDLNSEFNRHRSEPLEFTAVINESDAGERMKLVYRRLVRRLHPDMQGPLSDPTEVRWQKRIWHLSQVARQQGNVAELDALYKVSLLRQMELSELTISDAHEVHAWLKRESDHLEAQIREWQAHPAWGFSVSGESPALVQRVLNEFERERDFLAHELKDIKGQHAYLEVLSFNESGPPLEMKRRRVRPRHEERDERQLSLFED
ncbi:MAG: hypothetical protein KF799_09225 [Bdellovibrionales bacterium]|nr:hypothetical protein [Bdellovibrionales bacterium]